MIACYYYSKMSAEDESVRRVPDAETFRQRIARASQKRSAESFQNIADALIEESRRQPAGEAIAFSEEEIQEIGKVLKIPIARARDLCS